MRRDIKEKPLLERGFCDCCLSDRPQTKRHYLQLVGTYLVRILPPAATGRDCAVAVALSADEQAQSILPAKVFGNTVLFTDGVRTRTLAPANCVI